MDYATFEARAHEYWQEIPAEYREGVDGMRVLAETMPHPRLVDVYTLGECATESYPSDYGGPDTVRSMLMLYHGSFERIAHRDPDFDWDAELWETITHELRHHLEWLASEDALEELDYAVDENFKRHRGEAFDAFFYQAGERLAPDLYRVDGEYFLEIEKRDRPTSDEEIRFTWRGRLYQAQHDASAMNATDASDTNAHFISIELPSPPSRDAAASADGTTMEPSGETQPFLTLVVHRRVGPLRSLWRMLRRRGLNVAQSSARAVPVESHRDVESHPDGDDPEHPRAAQ